MGEGGQEALLTEYTEVSNNFRTLTDIRFKLLAFLPSAAAVTAILQAGGNLGDIELPLLLFGLFVTIGLITYNTRNDQLYDNLVARAAAIERSLNVPDGAFANRPEAWLRVPWFFRNIPGLRRLSWKIDHRTAVSTIYMASIALWLFGVVAYVLANLRDGSTNSFEEELQSGADLIAIVIAIAMTLLGSFLIKLHNKSQRKAMKRRAKRAMNLAVSSQSIFDTDIVVTDKFNNEWNDAFIKQCALLSSSEQEDVQARADFYKKLAQELDSERIRYYVPQDWNHVSQKSREHSACYLIGLLTDLPPLWIYDWGTERNERTR